MKIIVGLGNPDEKYARTRHNVGFMFADVLAGKWSCSFKYESKFDAEIAKADFDGEKVLIVKPQTYMNLSGNSVRALLTFYKLSAKDIFIVYDDIAMNLGALRFRANGSDGGHNGIKSIILNTGSDKFDRLKVGIGPQPDRMPSEVFVLQKFSDEQLAALSDVLKHSVLATEHYLVNGLQSAQNKFNCK